MPDTPKPIVSALIVSNNAKDLLLQCMHALFASADVPVGPGGVGNASTGGQARAGAPEFPGAVVVDNASRDGAAAAVTAEFPQATVLIQERNLGFGRAANVGLERCTGR